MVRLRVGSAAAIRCLAPALDAAARFLEKPQQEFFGAFPVLDLRLDLLQSA